MEKTKVLNISQFSESEAATGFHADTLQQHLLTHHKDIALPHAHNFYLAVLFTNGSGIHEIDFRPYTVSSGALFFLTPGQTHHWQLSSDTEGYIIFHSREFYELHFAGSRLDYFPFFHSFHNSPAIYLTGAALKKITQLFGALLAESRSGGLFCREALVSLTDLLYIESARAYPDKNLAVLDNTDNYYAKFRQFEALAGMHYKTEKSPAAYATLLNVSPRHLNRIVQAVTGKTATDVILDRVLLEAKKELVLRHSNFAQIAHGLGYEDYAYFSRLFKKKTGDSPSGFLMRYRQH